jgi:hypothetical protein
MTVFNKNILKSQVIEKLEEKFGLPSIVSRLLLHIEDLKIKYDGTKDNEYLFKLVDCQHEYNRRNISGFINNITDERILIDLLSFLCPSQYQFYNDIELLKANEILTRRDICDLIDKNLHQEVEILRLKEKILFQENNVLVRNNNSDFESENSADNASNRVIIKEVIAGNNVSIELSKVVCLSDEKIDTMNDKIDVLLNKK